MSKYEQFYAKNSHLPYKRQVAEALKQGWTDAEVRTYFILTKM